MAWIKTSVPGNKYRGCVSNYLQWLQMQQFLASAQPHPHPCRPTPSKIIWPEKSLACPPAAASWSCILKPMNLWDTEASKSFLKGCISSQHQVSWKAAASVGQVLGLSLPTPKSNPVSTVLLKVAGSNIRNVGLLNVLPLKLLSEITSRHSSVFWCI